MAVTVSRSSSDRRATDSSRAGAPRPRAPTPAPQAAPDLLTRLAGLRVEGRRFVTCYLKLEPRDRSRGKYLIKVKNRARAVLQALPRLGVDREAQEEVGRDLDRVQAWLRAPGNLPPTHGVALFACEALALFEAVPLPAVYRSRLAVDGTPLVRELAAAGEEFGRVLAVVLDRTSARFFEVTAFGAEELPGLRADSTRGKRFRGDGDGPPGWGEHTYHNRIRDEKQRHYEAIARALFELDRVRHAHGIVIGATGSEARAVEPFLHAYLRSRVIGEAKLNPKLATPAAVHTAALEVRAAHERASERALVAEMEEGLGTRWATNGIAPTLAALARGQVRALLVDADAAVPGYRCGATDRLVLDAQDCRGQGEPTPVLDVVDDAIEEALRQGVDVNVVHEPDARGRIDGLGALLRFR